MDPIGLNPLGDLMKFTQRCLPCRFLWEFKQFFLGKNFLCFNKFA